MTDTVLQSFCERCGRRYTLTEQEQKPEGGLSVLGRLVRRGSEPAPGEPTVSTTLPSSDRFEGTFHFCLECRQYTCADCWNTAAGSCVGCHPPGQVASVDHVERAASAQSRPAPPAFRSSPPKAAALASAPSQPPTPRAAGTDAGAAHRPRASGTPVEWGNDENAAAAILRAPVRSDPTARSSAGPGTAGTSGSGSDEEAAAVLDEWGRPVRRRAVDTTPDKVDEGSRTPASELDPWRGVVFSTDEAATLGTDADRDHTSVPSADKPLAGPPSAAPTWPAADQRREAPARPSIGADAWPETDTQRPTRKPPREAMAGDDDWPDEAPASRDGDDRGAGADGEAERHVDAASWAHANATVVGRASLVESPTSGTDAGEGEATATEAAQPQVAEPGVVGPEAAEPADISLRFVDPAEADVASADEEPVGAADEPEPAAEVPATPAPRETVEGPLAADAPAQQASAVDAVDQRAGSEADLEPAATAEREPAAPAEPAAPDESQPPASADQDEPAAPGESQPAAPAEPSLGPAPTPTVAAVPTSPGAAPHVPPPAASAGPAVPPPLAPLPTPPASPSRPWGTDVEPGPFSQPYTAAMPLQAPPPPPPGLPRPRVAAPQGIPVPATRQMSTPPQAPPPGPPPAAPPPGLTPPTAQATAAPPPGPLPGRTDRATTRACSSCALPLSAKARFCRRCGAPQG